MNGFYNISKPLNMTSSDAVVKLRGILRAATGEKKIKVGHLGTLDPMATGVLGIAVGEATKLFDYFLSKTKTYKAVIEFGKSTDTLDSAGNISRMADCTYIAEDMVVNAANDFLGEYLQIPPQFSAKSVGGVRAYTLARNGVIVPLEAKKVRIDEIKVKRKTDVEFFLTIKCGSGTYIRAICRDIGDKLNIPAYMKSLERIENGFMHIEDSVTLVDVEKDISNGFVSLETFASRFDRIDFDFSELKKLDNGVKINVATINGICSVYVEGIFYGVGTVTNGKLSLIAREKYGL